MKKITRTAATSALAVAALGLTAGTANAAPALTPPAPNNSTISIDVLPGVHYTGNAVDQSVFLNTGLGSLTTVGGQFQLLDGRGQLMAGTPLTPPSEPSAAAAPVTHMASAAVTPALPLHNVDATADFNGALAVAATQFGLATGVGAMAGGVTGLVGGCALGAITGGAIVGVSTAGLGALPAAGIGCIVGGATGAGIGAVAGGALLGIPVGIASGVQMFNTLNAPK